MRTPRPGGSVLAASPTLLVLAALVATAVPDPVPDDVAAWFGSDAVAAVTTTREGLDAGPRPVTVGGPHELHLWSEDFRAGSATDVPVTPLEQWIAPYGTDGRPAGSVTAWREEGVVTLAMTDDHAELAAALDGLPAEAFVVHEPMLAAYFALEGGTVTTLVPGFFEGPPAAPVSTFQAGLADQVDGLMGAVAPEPGPRWWVPVTWAVLAGAVLAALVYPLALARRRHGHT